VSIGKGGRGRGEGRGEGGKTEGREEKREEGKWSECEHVQGIIWGYSM
jgi:hypothetical protein